MNGFEQNLVSFVWTLENGSLLWFFSPLLFPPFCSLALLWTSVNSKSPIHSSQKSSSDTCQGGIVSVALSEGHETQNDLWVFRLQVLQQSKQMATGARP